MNAVDQVRSLGGAARTRELSASRHELARLVGSGHLVRLSAGCYATPDALPEYVAAARLNGTVSCVSALQRWGVMTYASTERIHVSVPSHRGTSRPVPPGVVRHFEDVPTPGAARCTTLVAAAARAVRCLPYDRAVATLDQVVRRAVDLKVPDALNLVLAAVARAEPALAAALEVDVDARARSLRESECRLMIRRAGLAAAPAVELPLVGEVDLLVEGLIVTEVDGFAHHQARREFRNDRRRDRSAADLGFLVKRYAWEDAKAVDVAWDLRGRLGSRPEVLPFATHVPDWARDEAARARAYSLSPANRVVGARLLQGRRRASVVWP